MFPTLDSNSPLGPVDRQTGNALLSRTMSVLCKVELGNDLQFRPLPGLTLHHLADDVIECLEVTFKNIIFPRTGQQLNPQYFSNKAQTPPGSSTATPNTSIHVKPTKFALICDFTQYLFSNSTITQLLFQMSETWVKRSCGHRVEGSDLAIAAEFLMLMQMGLHPFAIIRNRTNLELVMLFKATSEPASPAQLQNSCSPVNRIVSRTQYTSDSEASTSSSHPPTAHGPVGTKSYILSLLSESNPGLAQNLSQNPAALNALLMQTPGLVTQAQLSQNALLMQQQTMYPGSTGGSGASRSSSPVKCSPVRGLGAYLGNKPQAGSPHGRVHGMAVFPRAPANQLKQITVPQTPPTVSSLAQQQIQALDSAVYDAATSLTALTSLGPMRSDR